MNNIPKINRKAVCIATDRSCEIAKEVSAYFANTEDYFTVFHFPELVQARKEYIDFEEDGYIGQVIGGHSFVYIFNTILQIKPEFVIFAGLNESEKSYFSELPSEVIVNIDSLADIKNYSHLFDESLRLAGVQKNRQKPDNLVVIEDKHDLVTVTAENLARAMNSDVMYVEDTEDRVWNRTTKYIDEWKERGKYASYIKLENLVKSRVGSIDFASYKSATFFTNGLPYGLVLGNPIPFCYVHKRLRADIFIINSIIYSEKSFGTAICFSINQFLDSEPKEVTSIFERNNLHPIKLFQDKATAFNFGHYVGHLPYDILHISSHGGIKSQAYLNKEEFKDRKGKSHVIEYYEVPSFSDLPLESSGNIAVFTKMIFLKLDGARWMSRELEEKKLPKYVFEDMRKAIFFRADRKQKNKKDRVLVTDPIIDASTVMCNDGPHQGQFHEVAAQSAPLIFNNSCWSWSEIATYFLAGGVRGYIGTLWPITDVVATDGALKFYKDVLDQDKTIAVAIWEINKEVSSKINDQENIFFAWVLPFTKMKKASKSDFRNFVKELGHKLGGWIQKAATKKEKDVKGNAERIIDFIIWVANKEFKLDLIEISKEKVMETYNYDIKKHAGVLKRSSPL